MFLQTFKLEVVEQGWRGCGSGVERLLRICEVLDLDSIPNTAKGGRKEFKHSHLATVLVLDK
jgi:hypothetical protein